MNYSKISLVAKLSLLMFCTSFLFTQCSKNNRLAFSDDIKKHFGDMHYTEVTIPKSNLSNLRSISGKGIVKDRLGESVNVSWFVLVDGKGEIGGFFTGSQKLSSTGTVALTVDEAEDRIQICNTKEGEELVRCVDQFMIDLWTDCFLASDEEVEEQCWFLL